MKNMNRKEAIQTLSVLLGGAVISSQLLMNWSCGEGSKDSNFSAEDIALFAMIGDTIIPETDTPGAKEAGIGEFIALLLKDCYDADARARVREGLDKINELSNKKFGSPFVKLTANQRIDVLSVFDKERQQTPKDSPEHFFTILKHLTLLGYFTSEAGATKALNYLPVPGRYEGCIDFKAGDKLQASM